MRVQAVFITLCAFPIFFSKGVRASVIAHAFGDLLGAYPPIYTNCRQHSYLLQLRCDCEQAQWPFFQYLMAPAHSALDAASTPTCGYIRPGRVEPKEFAVPQARWFCASWLEIFTQSFHHGVKVLCLECGPCSSLSVSLSTSSVGFQWSGQDEV